MLTIFHIGGNISRYIMNSIHHDFEKFSLYNYRCMLISRYQQYNELLPNSNNGLYEGKVNVSLMSKTHNTDLHIITCK